MKRNLVFVLGLLVSLSVLVNVRFRPAEVIAFNGYRVHNVNTGLNYTSIQEAIDAPETLNGHTVSVEEGTYFEHVIVDKSLTLLGEDRETTIIDGNMTGNVVQVTQDHVNIRGFTIQRSGQAYSNSGIYVGSTQNCDISANRIVDDEFGIFGSPRNMSITDNTIEANYLGVALDSGATSNVISRNHLVANYVSVHLNYADANYILQNNMTNNYRSVTLWNSKDNRLYHNSFLNSTFGSVNNANFLDNGLEGNYWSEYNGSDLNHDGIGDVPYTIDVNNTDNYPLMGMFSKFNVFLPYEKTENVTVISNSTVSNLSLFIWLSSPYDGLQPGQPFIQFLAAGENGSGGFCRLMMPRNALNGSSYIVLVDWDPINATQLPVSNSTHIYLYFTYTHSTHEVIVTIPEFSWFILSLFMVATLVIVHKRKRILDT